MSFPDPVPALRDFLSLRLGAVAAGDCLAMLDPILRDPQANGRFVDLVQRFLVVPIEDDPEEM